MGMRKALVKSQKEVIADLPNGTILMEDDVLMVFNRIKPIAIVD